MEENMSVRGKLLKFKRAFHGQIERQDKQLETKMLQTAHSEKNIIGALQSKLQKFEEHVSEQILHLETKEEKLADAEERIAATDKRDGDLPSKRARPERIVKEDTHGSQRRRPSLPPLAHDVHPARSHLKLEKELKEKNQLIKSLEKKLKLAQVQPAGKKTNAAKEEKSVAHPLTDQKHLKHRKQQVNTAEMIAALRNIAEKAGYDLIPNGVKIDK
mmetsp:Transcript_23711/g.77194  ORF Transcript_23711/g.77194 Transcript_23711/m.77194 type:complete len:216 (+) Transcript_23711:132-779(+)